MINSTQFAKLENKIGCLTSLVMEQLFKQVYINLNNSFMASVISFHLQKILVYVVTFIPSLYNRLLPDQVESRCNFLSVLFLDHAFIMIYDMAVFQVIEENAQVSSRSHSSFLTVVTFSFILFCIMFIEAKVSPHDRHGILFLCEYFLMSTHAPR